MTHNFVRKVQTLAFATLATAALITAVLTMLLGQSSRAQVTSIESSLSVAGASARGLVTTAKPGQQWLSLANRISNQISLSGSEFGVSPLDSGNPLFLPVVDYNAGGNLTYALATADLNGDGVADVVTTNYEGTVGVLIGRGDGTFKNVVSYTGGVGAVSVDIADVNGDHKPDLIVVNMNCPGVAQTCVTVMLGNGDGTFKPATTNAAGGYTYAWGGPIYISLAVADLNHDGRADIVVANQCTIANTTVCENGSLGVLLGNGDGTFQPEQTYSSGGFLGADVVIADLNGDGRPDLIVTNCAALGSDCSGDPQSGNGQVGILMGNGDGTFQPVQTYSSGAMQFFWSQVVVVDVNGDGIPDMLVANEGGDGGSGEGSVGILLGKGNGTFQPVVKYDSGSTFAAFIAVGDLNGDGHPDLAVSNLSGTMGVLLANGDGTFQPVHTYPASIAGSFAVQLQDINGDSKLDAVVASSSAVNVLLGNGDGTFQPTQGFSSGGFMITEMAIADVDGNGSPDLLVTNWCPSQPTCVQGQNEKGTVGVLLNSANGSLEATTTNLASSLNPSNFGQSVTFTATVASSSGTPTGLVNFYDGSTLLGSGALSGGTTSLTTSGLGAGSHSISAGYQGSTNFRSSTSTALNQVVNGTNTTTTTTLTSSKNPSVYQTPVTFTAVVTASSGTPTGTVTFFDGSSALGNGTLTSGTASLTTSALVRGPHSITASYLGAGNFAPSVSAVLNQVVNLGGLFDTQTKLNHPGPSFVGQPVTFIATVTSKGGAIPDGDTVTFSDESLGNLGTGITRSGVASFTTSTLSPRSHIIGALYNGDANFNTSFTQITQVVNKYPTTTVLTSSLNPASYGQSITFTATVTSSGPTPTGTVRFTGIGSATLVGGVATFTKPQLRAGTYAITADYVGDGDSATSKSSVLQEVVNPASTTIALTSSVNPSSAGQTVTFTATVSSSTGIDPFGKVTFTAGATTLGTVALKNKVASISTSTLPTGSTKITATYGGAAGFTGSATSLTQKVNP